METKKLKKNALFNPEGDTETRLRKMIGGNTTNLNDFNKFDFMIIFIYKFPFYNNQPISRSINLIPIKGAIIPPNP